jgi:hypothetical protein
MATSIASSGHALPDFLGTCGDFSASTGAEDSLMDTLCNKKVGKYASAMAFGSTAFNQ